MFDILTMCRIAFFRIWILVKMTRVWFLWVLRSVATPFNTAFHKQQPIFNNEIELNEKKENDPRAPLTQRKPPFSLIYFFNWIWENEFSSRHKYHWRWQLNKSNDCVDRMNFIISALHQTDHSLILFQDAWHTLIIPSLSALCLSSHNFKNTFRIKEQNNQKRSKLMKKMHAREEKNTLTPPNHPMKLH